MTRDKRLLVARLALTVPAVLAPLKFGSVAVTGEISLLPTNAWEWLYSAWPPFFLPAITGAALLLVLLLIPRPPESSRFWLLPGAWLLLFLAALAGLVKTTETDTASITLWHFLGVSLYATAVFWAAHEDDRLLPWLLAAVTFGTLLSALDGWYQVKGGGLAETLAFAEKAALEKGQPLSPEFLNRLQQRRAFGPFVYPNSFAAHVILTGPVAALVLWRWGRRFPPARVSQALFITVGIVTLGGALWLSGSRAAVVALGGGFAVAVVCFRGLNRRWRLALLAAGLLTVGGLLAVVNQGRALESLGARGEYYRVALKMFAMHPDCGAGWGEFFPYYMRYKTPQAEETRLPHSMLLGSAAQAGVPGALAAILCLSLPLLLPAIFRRAGSPESDPLLLGCVQAGLAAWSLHALVDFNSEIPGTMMLAAALPLLLMPRPPRPAAGGPRPRRWLCLGAVGLGLVGLASLWRLPGEYHYMRLQALSQNPTVDLDLVFRQAKQTSDWLPGSPYPWLLAGRIAESRNAPGLAVTAYREAVRRAPHRSASYLHLAENQLRLGNREAATRSAGSALEWYPHSPRNLRLGATLGLLPGPSTLL